MWWVVKLGTAFIAFLVSVAIFSSLVRLGREEKGEESKNTPAEEFVTHCKGFIGILLFWWCVAYLTGIVAKLSWILISAGWAVW